MAALCKRIHIRRMRRACLFLLTALAAAGCAGAPQGSGLIQTADPIRAAQAQLGIDTTGRGDTALAFVPGLAGSLMISEVVLPEAGAVIGDRFDGVQFQRSIGALHLTGAARSRWAALFERIADSTLTSRGFRVRPRPSRSSDAAALTGVRFTLQATVHLQVNVTGANLSPARARATVDWQLIDLAQGGPVFIGGSEASSPQSDSLEAALASAFAGSIRYLIGYEMFRRAIMQPRVLNISDVISASWARPLPPADEAVLIAPGVRELSQRTNALGGTIAILGPRGFRASGIVLTEDGFAVAGAHVGQQRYIYVKQSNGAERPARVIRVSGGLALLELNCLEPCAAVPWGTGNELADRQDVLLVRAGSMGIRYFESRIQARGGRWRLPGLRLDGGEAVISTATGAVIGVATRNAVLSLDSALALLNVRVAGNR